MSKGCVLRITETDMSFTSEQIQQGKPRFCVRLMQKTIFSTYKLNGSDDKNDICIQFNAVNFSKIFKSITHHTKSICIKLTKKNQFDVFFNVIIEQVSIFLSFLALVEFF